MTVVAAVRPTPPTPEECDHPDFVVGVLAQEFAPYSNAMGPEGRRRTTMYYGPVVGGLPIDARHCELCGLLRLSYPDGRAEDRRLYPGPQPGLLRVAVAEATASEARSGRYARVSGVTAPDETYARLLPPAPAMSLPKIELPAYPFSLWLTLAALACTCIGLLLTAYGSVEGYVTASWVGSMATFTAISFGSAVVIQVWVATQRHFFPFPELRPSVATRLRGEPQIDGVTATLVTILVIIAVGLSLAGILAAYDWRTPAALTPLVWGLVGLFVVGCAVSVVAAALRHVGGARHRAGGDLPRDH